MNIQLVKLAEDYKRQLFDMMSEWLAAEQDFSPWAIRKNDYRDFDYYLEHLELREPEGSRVPDSVFFCLDVDRNIFVGAVNIRHYLNDSLLFTGGHIGDGIRPSERRKGFATSMISLALEECRKLGIPRVLMTCDKDNVASAKSILRNGGVLENEVINEEGVPEQRYWIDLTGRWDAAQSELLDVVDSAGQPTDGFVPRAQAHIGGIRHRTSHVWLFRHHNGRLQLLLQLRSVDKDSWPGCYDISSAGHIPSGEDFVGSALRELREELGVCAAAEELIFCGDRTIQEDGVFHGLPYHDRQYSRIFALRCNRDVEAFTPQPEEIQLVRWMDFDECLTAVKQNTIPHCIYPEELEMVSRTLHRL